MRHRLWMFAALAVLCAHAPQAAAQPLDAARYAEQARAKFVRGFANATTGWLEIPKEVVLESKRRNVLYGVTIGLLYGAAQTVGRTLTGAVELGTFLVPSPEFVHPRFVWDPFSEETRYGRR